ncbi:hypothetical protein AVEN_238809-1 [Araneus ventricosus]|uniref:Uncharacterized protein n=1 Tax=Araneus ventricosus TaxID=182803 RepID=A0A4Y2HKH9_ARAVE|nr:hypothetical protein AVEN_238809-1 [Araneus ventricosus]
MDSSAPFLLFFSLRVVGDINGRPFISHFSPKGPFNDHSPNCLLPPFETATGRNPLHSYRSCMAGYGRLRSQSVNPIIPKTIGIEGPQNTGKSVFLFQR